MTQVIANDVSAIQPEIWSSMVQVPLYKSLVALDVANMKLSDTLKYADTIKRFLWELFTRVIGKQMSRI